MNDFERLWDEIGRGGVMVLSTCAENKVTSRAMSVVVINGKFYCQTNKDYLKCRQIAENTNVALSYRNYSVEGVCRNIGSPYEVKRFITAMEQIFPDAVKRWSKLPEECVLEITPVLIRSWVYENNVPFIEEWDIENGTYRKDRQ